MPRVGRSMALLEGFLHSLFQLKAGTPLKQGSATLVDEPKDEAHFKWACARGKLGPGFSAYNVGAPSVSRTITEVASAPEAVFKENVAPDTMMRDAANDAVVEGDPK